MYQNINGNSGIYDGKITNDFVRMARNSVANFKEYLTNYTRPRIEMPDLSNLSKLTRDEFQLKMSEFDKAMKQLEENEKNRAPIHYVQRYTGQNGTARMPGAVDTNAVLGAAYEELDKRISVPTSEITQGLQSAFDGFSGSSGVELSADALDLNNDGQIDIGEYASSILVSDALSSDETIMNASNINGILTDRGEEKALVYANKMNYDIANKTHRALYEYYGLEEAKKQFTQVQNNLI